MTSDGNRGPDGFTPDERDAQWARAARLLAGATRCVLPLYIERGRRVPDHAGCGTLVNVGGLLTLFTARHVAVNLLGGDGRAFMAVGELGLQQLTGAVHVHEPVDGIELEQDDLDAAVIVVGPAGSSSLAGYSHVLTPEEAADRPATGDELFLLGYPQRRATKVTAPGVIGPGYNWWKGPAIPVFHKGETQPSAAVLGMHADLERMVGRDGKSRRSPSPKGVSGSAVWRSTVDERALLVGIFTGAPKGFFMGTYVAAHLQLVAKFAPKHFKAFLAR